ncbi:MAG: hypothetical protein GXP08_14385 [Gammaproteobacteria bacterium]|nr:hypothetical protein [Gammaproteobacteria bacterium]
MSNLESIVSVTNLFPRKTAQSFIGTQNKVANQATANNTSIQQNSRNIQTTANKASRDLSTNPGDKENFQSNKTEINKLSARDREVRAHEAAHKAAGGQLTGAAQFDYQQGPNNKRYAVGGEVSIDTSKITGNPQATLLKAAQIRVAALAPANPSAQDRVVASQASIMAAEAQTELREETRIEREKQTESILPGNKTVEETEIKHSGEGKHFSQQISSDIGSFTANTEAAITSRFGTIVNIVV